MSAVIATPELMTQAATDLASIGSTVNAAHMTAAVPTVAVMPAAADEVSAGIARLFSRHAQDYHALAGKASAFQDQFVQHLTAGAGAYASAETLNVASLLKPFTANAAPVASLTAAQSMLNDLITNITTNIDLLLFSPLGAPLLFAIGALTISVFTAWLIADFAALLVASATLNIVASSPWFGLVLNAAIDAINPLLAAFPVLGQLISAVTPLVGSSVSFFFFPVIYLVALSQL